MIIGERAQSTKKPELQSALIRAILSVARESRIMFSVTVKEFGPIKSGKVTLRPLTILIGPNNSGKSYLALLVYALFNPFGTSGFRFLRYPYWRGASPVRGDFHLTKSVTNWFIEIGKKGLAKRGTQKHEGRLHVKFSDLPDDVKEHVRKAVKVFTREMTALLNQELQRGFASELSDLVKKRAKSKFRLIIEQSNPP